VSATAEEITQADAAGAETAPEPAEEPEIGREELLDAIAATLAEGGQEARDRLLAEVYLEASSHRQLLEQIAGTMSELLADPKRIVRAFFGRGKRGRRGDEPDLQAIAEIAAGKDDEEGCAEC
jgi:hypothetical protein